MMCHIVKISHHKNWKKSKFILHFKTKHFKALIKKDLKESQKYINTAFLYFTSFTFESGIITVIIVIWDTKCVITFYFCEKTLPGRFVHRLLWQFYVHRLISTISGIASLFWNFFCLFLKRLNVNFSPYRAERVRGGDKKGNVKNKKMFYFKQKKLFCDPKFFMFQALALSLSMEHYFPLKDSMRHLLNNVLTIKNPI